MQDVIRLWPNAAPGAVGEEEADVPTLTPVLPPPEARTGTAMIICPGGGYTHLAAHEGGPVGEWLAGLGICAFVLKYRHGPRYLHPAPMLDAQRAIRTVRSRAAEWGIDAQRIGILGFSAGGHLTATAGTHFDAGEANAEDAVERVSSRPDLIAPIYAVISLTQGVGERVARNLLGAEASKELVEEFSNDLRVTAETPPAFLAHTVEDPVVDVEHSVMFAMALRKHKIPFELHLFERGRHGLGLGAAVPGFGQWPAVCATWLRVRGWAR